MYIGLGIVLLVAGCILAFDVITVDINYVNDNALGAVLIAGGIIAILLSFAFSGRYRRAAVVEDRRVVEEPPIVEERRYPR